VNTTALSRRLLGCADKAGLIDGVEKRLMNEPTKGAIDPLTTQTYYHTNCIKLSLPVRHCGKEMALGLSTSPSGLTGTCVLWWNTLDRFIAMRFVVSNTDIISVVQFP